MKDAAKATYEDGGFTCTEDVEAERRCLELPADPETTEEALDGGF